MKNRDVIIGFIVLVILVTGVVVIRNASVKKNLVLPTPTPTITQKVNTAFPTLNIPAGTERANLTDVTGGNSLGVATRTEINANLPALASGQSYQVLLENSGGKTVNLGNMRFTKSGYLLQYNSTKYPGYNKVIIVRGITHVLEGSF